MMMAIARPLLLLTQVIRRGTGVINHVRHCPVSLSSREISPLTIKQGKRQRVVDTLGSCFGSKLIPFNPTTVLVLLWFYCHTLYSSGLVTQDSRLLYYVASHFRTY